MKAVPMAVLLGVRLAANLVGEKAVQMVGSLADNLAELMVD